MCSTMIELCLPCIEVALVWHTEVFDTKDARVKFDSVDRAFLSYVTSDDH